MPLITVTSLDDPRVALYRNLKDKVLDRSHDRFMAEGRHVVERLLQSDYEVESVLVDERRLHYIEDLLPPELPLYVGAPKLVDEIAGFAFHAGVLAIGKRKPSPTLDEVMSRYPIDAPLTVVIPADLNSTENLGTLLRTSAGFGAAAIILGERSCDPYYRQCVRVSMGTIFSLPLVRSPNLAADLHRLRTHWKVEVAATVLADGAEDLYFAKRPTRFALMFGSEDQGLPADLVAAANRKITLPMRLNTDSLNVSIAAGIFLYHFTRPDVVGG